MQTCCKRGCFRGQFPGDYLVGSGRDDLAFAFELQDAAIGVIYVVALASIFRFVDAAAFWET